MNIIFELLTSPFIMFLLILALAVTIVTAIIERSTANTDNIDKEND